MNRIPMEEFLSNLSAAVQAITRERVAGAHEFISHDVVGYSTSDSPFDRICYIATQKKGYGNFGFFFGAGMPDPKELLSGDGKRLRDVKTWSVEEARNPALAKLIAETWKEVSESIANVHAGRTKSKA